MHPEFRNPEQNEALTAKMIEQGLIKPGRFLNPRQLAKVAKEVENEKKRNRAQTRKQKL